MVYSIDSTTWNVQRQLTFTKLRSNLTEVLLNNQITISTDSLKDNLMLLRRQQELNKLNFERIDLNLPSFMNIIYFKYNSPFLSKYSLIHNRISEFGLEKKCNSLEKKWYEIEYKVANSNIDDSDDTLLIILVSLLSLGILVSCCAFVI